MKTPALKIIILLVIGGIIFGVGLYTRIAYGNVESGFCTKAPCGDEAGEPLDEVSYLFVSPDPETLNAASKPLGVFLGTYAVTFRTCANYTYKAEDTSWSCGNNPAQSTAGYGLLFMQYPTDKPGLCPIGGCLLVPKVKLLIPYVNQEKWDWLVAELNRASGVYGHEWNATTEIYRRSDINIRSVLADFDFPYGINP